VQGAGFIEDFDVKWQRTTGRNKSIVYQSRLTWTSAQAATRFPDRAEMYLTMTRRGAACLADTMWDKQAGGFFWTIGPDGKPLTQTKQLYGHAFGMYALAASYQATKDPAALDLAKRAFQWMEDHAHDNANGGYFESIDFANKPINTTANAVGAGADQKSMNTSIHILEALSGLYQIWPDPAVKTRLAEMLDICRDNIYSEPGYLTQYLSADWKRTPSPDSFGHDVEAGFLMVEAAELLGRPDLDRFWTAARHLSDRAVKYGWDTTNGGLYEGASMDSNGIVTGIVGSQKVWWIEAEHLNALLLLHEHFGRETRAYWDAFVKQWAWIKESQVDHTNGGWWPYVRADGTPTSKSKADMWTECYHQGRAMMVVTERLRRLAAAAE
jgi:mannobiose 2-epimerase